MTTLELDSDFLENATALTNFEAAQKLETGLSGDQNDLVESACSYAQQFSQVKSEADLKSIRTYLENSYDPYEIVTLVNLLPMDPDAARTYCRSLKGRSDEELKETIDYIRSIIR